MKFRKGPKALSGHDYACTMTENYPTERPTKTVLGVGNVHKKFEFSVESNSREHRRRRLLIERKERVKIEKMARNKKSLPSYLYDDDNLDDINDDHDSSLRIQEYSWDDDYTSNRRRNAVPQEEEEDAAESSSAEDEETEVSKQEFLTTPTKINVNKRGKQHQQETCDQLSQQENSSSVLTHVWKEWKLSGTVSKVLILVVIGAVVMFSTDSIELISSSTSSDKFNDVSDVSWKDAYSNAIDRDKLKHHVVKSQIHNNQVKKENNTNVVGGTQESNNAENNSRASEKEVSTPTEEASNEEKSNSESSSTATTKAGTENSDVAENSKVATTTTSNPFLVQPGTRHTYHRRSRQLNDDEAQSLMKQWGSWTFVDANLEQRPKDDYYEKYPNRDIPRTEFPPKAWQTDHEYLSKFLPEGIALVERAQKAILVEYGAWNSTTKSTDNDDINSMFYVFRAPNLTNGEPKKWCNDCTKKGGWTSEKSWKGLKRRILHAIMTEDNFIFAMGGHSAAAGHGNHFQQSYTLQVQRILEPAFARLGVRHQSRNFGNGGLGTLQNSIAAGSIYGPDVDILMWDSGMTEKKGEDLGLFVRQALLGGVKIPVMWSLSTKGLSFYNTTSEGSIDVGYPGDGSFGIRKAHDFDDLETIPWAQRYMQCGNDIKSSICKKQEYNGTCWIDRPDYSPEKQQNKSPGGKASWHPGFRPHQLRGRILAYTFLQAIKEVLIMWNDSKNYQLSDDLWHVTSYYKEMREKVLATSPDVTKCSNYESKGLGFLCKYPMKVRTYYEIFEY